VVWNFTAQVEDDNIHLHLFQRAVYRCEGNRAILSCDTDFWPGAADGRDRRQLRVGTVEGLEAIEGGNHNCRVPQTLAEEKEVLGAPLLAALSQGAGAWHHAGRFRLTGTI
jgi:hypothetical protein